MTFIGVAISFINIPFKYVGEAYFDALKQPYVYIQALILTGQFEAAIEFMSRISGMKSHAVHIAIALHENHLLLCGEPSSPIRK